MWKSAIKIREPKCTETQYKKVPDLPDFGVIGPTLEKKLPSLSRSHHYLVVMIGRENPEEMILMHILLLLHVKLQLDIPISCI